MELYVDDDGYVCFMDGEIFWTLHHRGWEAFLPGKIMPCYETHDYLFPRGDILGEVMGIYVMKRRAEND